jgi:hypothetical protein
LLWRVYGCFDADLFARRRLETRTVLSWRVYGCFDADLFAGRRLETRTVLSWRVYGCLNTDFFAERRLEARAVLSFSDVDSRVQVVVLMRALENELALFLAVSVMARKLYVDLSCRIFSAKICVSWGLRRQRGNILDK